LTAETLSPRARSEQHARVWTFAEQLALREHRAVTADDLRHACYLAAFGRVASMRAADPMTNGEFNRLLALWAVLIDPDNLAAQVDWMHPEEAARRGLVASILRSAPGEAYVIAISKRKFGTAAWRDLGDRQL
jgi:arylamine N-acetyltransferase